MTDQPQDIDTTEIHQVLSNERRRMVIECLRENGGSISARELSERIATLETGEEPPPTNIRQSAYVSLQQTHLPKLDELGIVDYESNSKQVMLQDTVDQVAVYMETVPKYGISWSEYYAGTATIGLLLVVGAKIGVPLIASIGSSVWAALAFILIGASGIYQTIQQGSSILHRRRSNSD